MDGSGRFRIGSVSGMFLIWSGQCLGFGSAQISFGSVPSNSILGQASLGSGHFRVRSVWVQASFGSVSDVARSVLGQGLRVRLD